MWEEADYFTASQKQIHFLSLHKVMDMNTIFCWSEPMRAVEWAILG